MTDILNEIKEWVVTLGDKHGVDPLFLGILYLTSKVFFFFFLGWVIKNLRSKKPFVFQLLIAGMSFCIPYTYIIIAGRNISVWVYLLIGVIFSYGAFSIWKKLTTKPALLDENDPPIPL